MPLVLTQNERSASGHKYGDVLGVEYEYPTQYRKKIQLGEPFIYYRGSRGGDGARKVPAYIGRGVIGEIAQSQNRGNLTCSIEDFQVFEVPVPFKVGDAYLEPVEEFTSRPQTLYFRQGVRQVTEEVFAKILAAAEAMPPESSPAPTKRGHSGGWPSPEMAKLVDAIAMELAVAHLKCRHSGVVRRMPHNNPGYDILVCAEDAALGHVEVKGTTRPKPHFFMSEGERLFSEAHADSYTLLVVYDIDVQSRTGLIHERPGPVRGDDLELSPVTWEARFS